MLGVFVGICVLLGNVVLVLSKCIVFNGETEIENNDRRVCIPGLYANDSGRAFVTHSWNAQFVSPGSYSVLSSLVFTTSCSGVRLRRANSTSSATVSWFVVVCRDGEIKNVWRGDVAYSQNYTFDGMYSRLEGLSHNVSDNSLIVGSYAIGGGTRFSRDDFACMEFAKPGILDTNTSKTFAVRFIYKPNSITLDNALAHVQVIDWNSTAATVSNTSNPLAIPFATACGIDQENEASTNFVSLALVFNTSDRSIALNANFQSEISFARQYLVVPENLATVHLDAVAMDAGKARVAFRNISDEGHTWAIILGTANMLGVPSRSATTITDVVVAASVKNGEVVVKRTTSQVPLTVHVATIIFHQTAPTLSPTISTRPSTIPTTPTTPTIPTTPTTGPSQTTRETASSLEESTTTTTTTTTTTMTSMTTSALTITVEDESTVVNISPPATAAAAAIDQAIVGGAAGGGALLLIIAVIVALCACKARKSSSKLREPPATGQALAHLDMSMSSARYDIEPSSTYGDVSDVRTQSALYGDVGDVRTSSEVMTAKPSIYGDIGDVRT
jgi:hypothetical protein